MGLDYFKIVRSRFRSTTIPYEGPYLLDQRLHIIGFIDNYGSNVEIIIKTLYLIFHICL